MTNEEMVYYLEHADVTVGQKCKTKTAEAIEKALKIIATQPCEDCKVKKEAYIQGYDYGVKDWFKAKTEPCDDCISREAVMKCFKKWQPYMATRLWDYEQELKDLPSVQPQSKRGKWISIDATHSMCEKCEAIFEITSPNAEVNFCPNCGVLVESEM